MDIPKRIELILKIMDLGKKQSSSCEGCEICKVSKTIKDKIITLCAEVIAEQSKIIHERNSSKIPVNVVRPKPPGGIN